MTGAYFSSGAHGGSPNQPTGHVKKSRVCVGDVPTVYEVLVGKYAPIGRALYIVKYRKGLHYDQVTVTIQSNKPENYVYWA